MENDKKIVFWLLLIIILLIVFIGSFKFLIFIEDSVRNPFFSYINGEIGSLDVEGLNNREISHMSDVKGIFSVLNSFWLFLLMFSVPLIFILFNSGEDLFKCLGFCGYSGIVLIAFSCLFFFNFSFFFNVFHSFFFIGGSWFFPSDSLLILSFPLDYFISFLFKFLIISLVIFVSFIGYYSFYKKILRINREG